MSDVAVARTLRLRTLPGVWREQIQARCKAKQIEANEILLDKRVAVVVNHLVGNRLRKRNRYFALHRIICHSL